jgi:hypothetical protein
MDDRMKALFAAASQPPNVPAADKPDTHQSDAQTTETRRPGAPAGNTNALKNGLRSGKFPPGTEYLSKEITRFKGLCVTAIAEIHGEVGFQQLALLQTAIEHYSHGLRVRRWLRVGWDDLTADQVLAYSREIGRAFDARDKVLKQLGIDAASKRSTNCRNSTITMRRRAKRTPPLNPRRRPRLEKSIFKNTMVAGGPSLKPAISFRPAKQLLNSIPLASRLAH